MKLYVVYQWGRFDNVEYNRKYFCNQENAMKYYKDRPSDCYDSWDWDEIETEDNPIGFDDLEN